MKRQSLRKLFFACALVLAFAANAVVARPATTLARPALVIQTLDGKTFHLAQERGRWVIVNFWATWCAPCVVEMPAISKFVATRKDVAAIGLAWDESPRAEILKFAHEHPVDYPLAQVDMHHPPADFPAPQALPATYLIAPDGRVVKHFLGPVTARSLARAISAAATDPAIPVGA